MYMSIYFITNYKGTKIGLFFPPSVKIAAYKKTFQTYTISCIYTGIFTMYYIQKNTMKKLQVLNPINSSIRSWLYTNNFID